MKPTRFVKKLRLNKNTVAHLINGEMKDVHGGGGDPETRRILPDSGCYICPTEGGSICGTICGGPAC